MARRHDRNESHTILVTGGAGFIGCWLVRALLLRGYRVRVLDDLSTGNLANLPTHPWLEVLEGDVVSPEDVFRAAQGAFLLVHLAAVVGVRLAHAQAGRAYSVSVDSARNVLAAAQGPVVLASSSAVYGLTRCGEAREDHEIDERSVLAYDGGAVGYALGKWHAECLARDAVSRGHEVVVLRLFNTVGPRQSDRYGMVLPTFVRAALAGKPLMVHGDGLQTRCFSDVHTVTETILRLAVDNKRRDTSVFNIGSDAPVSIIDVARMVIEETGSSSSIVHVPYAEIFPGREDVRWRRPDTSRLQQTVGPVHWPDIRSMVKEVIAWEEREQL
jgi:UDP-glucose 4-epimerase